MKWYSFIFFCNVCVVKCHSIAISEIEDFSNYLKETSQLDQNVKSSYPDNDYDDEESISDDAWEESGKFEGDLVLNERQRRLIVANVAEGLARNGLTDTTKRWPNNEVVYFIQKEHFTSDQVQAIQDGIDDLARSSCVKFTPYKKGDRDAVVIQGSRRGCFSQVGYQGGYQVLNLSGRHPVGRGCFRHGTVVHELLHTLGFYHMQSSHDRDDYIDIIWENIVRPARHNFRKYNSFSVSDFGVGYDYDSVLHYSRKAFSSNGQDTIVPKQSGSNIGQRIGLSEKDVQKLNKMYCDTDSNLLDENSEPNKSVSKKKAKNRPFEGHGIGYQQGKTVIIKLPMNQQDEVAHSPQITNQFSSAPKTMQAMAFVQGLGVGKEINYDFPPLTSSIQRDNMVSVKVPTLQNNQHPINPDISKIYPTENGDTTDDESLNEALHEFAKKIKTQANPYPATFNYDYSKYMNPEKDVLEKPQMLNDKSLYHIHSETDEDNYNRFTSNYKPTYITHDKTNQFYLRPKGFSQELRLHDHNTETDFLKLHDQRNHGYAPKNEQRDLQIHNYTHVYNPVLQSGDKNMSPFRGVIQIEDSYRKENEKMKPNNNEPYIYENSDLNNYYPSIQNAHTTERESYTLPYGYSVPVSHSWHNNENPNHEYYRNKYPDSAEDYR